MDRAGGAASTSWSHQQFSHQDQHHPNAPGDDADFGNLLNLDVGDLDLGGFDMDETMNLAGSGHVTPNAQHGAGQSVDSIDDGGFLSFDPSEGPSSNPQQFPPNMFPPNQSQQMEFPQHHSVPPTPNSFEMQGRSGPFGHGNQNQPGGFKPQFSQAQPNMYTPATTPGDGAFQLPPGYTVPGAYFSPLTSPSIEPRTYANQIGYQHYSVPPSASTSAATSPVDATPSQEEANPRPPVPNARRRGANNRKTAPRSTGPSPTAQQAALANGRRKRGAASTSDIPDLMPQAPLPASHVGSHLHPRAASNDGHLSSADSVSSPEPLSESVMGPPPRPKSSSHSPYIAGKQQESSGMPATPASLMRLAQTSGPGSAENTPRIQASSGSTEPPVQSPPAPAMDDLSLPEAASGSGHSKRSSVISVDTPSQVQEGSVATGSRKTPKLGPLSTPSGGSKGVKASPSGSTVASPVSSVGPSRAGRGSTSKRTRPIVSPSIRPKISPQIKPLLPGGGSGDDSHALLLAQRSNYQNIIEGTSVPGLTYHKDLSTTLTSKRTSHKLAEQGRRNRINTALQEMQALLPCSSPPTSALGSPVVSAANSTDVVATAAPGKAGGKASSDRPGTAGSKGVKSPDLTPQQQNSKAATVESAIEYIKVLREEVGQRDAILAEKEAELAQLRAQLKGVGVTSPDPKPMEEPANGEEASTDDKK